MASKTLWYVKSEERDYHTGCFETKAEAVYRLNEIAASDFYTAGAYITRRAVDWFTLSDGATFRVVKL